jgi:asparagine synthase (glutamine-hydrolysing)
VPFDDAGERLRELFLNSVRIHLRSDVPVGAAFSGGVDSSANVTAMRALSGNSLELHTFGFVPEDPALSEERWMSLVADEVGAELHMVTPRPEELLADLDDLIDVQAEPFGSTSIYAQSRVFRLARDAGIKVMLDGQGADELFAGYRHYLPARLSGLVAGGQLVSAARFLSALRSLPGASPARVSSWAVGAALPTAAQAPIRRLAGRPLVPEWLDADWLTARGVSLGDPWRDSGGTTLRAQRLISVQSTLRTLLRYEDRNSMASSIESRVPFLTPALAEFAAGLPDDYLIAPDGTGKFVLRRSLRGLVPDPILDRRDKIGFATPESSWLRALGPWIDNVLDSDPARAAGPLRVPQIRARWAAAESDSGTVDPATWRWLNLIRWVDRFAVALD